MATKLCNPMILYARWLAKAGYKILPLYEPTSAGCSCGNPSCSHVGKHPRTAHGVQDASRDIDVIERWWKYYPEANIGVATGSDSGIFVLDVDGDEGRETLAKLMADEKSLPLDARINTARGAHYYFHFPALHVGNKPLGPGLDVRGERGYVVGPGSRHASGVRYRLARWGQANPRLVPVEPPHWLLIALSALNKPLVTTKTGGVKTDQQAAYAEAAFRGELDYLRQAQEGTRNTTLNKAAFRVGQLVGAGVLDASSVEPELMSVALAIGLHEAEAAATLRSGLQAGQRCPREFDWSSGAGVSPTVISGDPLAEELAALGQTDADNGLRLARRFTDRLVCTPGKGYLVHVDGRWRRDDQRMRFAFAEETARAIAHEAAYLSDPRDKAGRATFATGSLSKGALDRMLDVAKHHLMKADALFDANPFLLNVKNGTLDLQTGILRPHAPADLLTKLVPVAYEREATCPTFERFLERALKSDPEVIAFLQKAIGYTLTGDTSEQVFFFAHGPGATGKSTLINLIRDLIGDYGLHTPTETLMAKQHDNGIPTDLARLQGARMVTAVEVNWTRQIDEARVKALTGGDPITARHLYQDFFEFQPACKLWFAANDLPGVRGTAEAFWRRVRLIPFEVEIPADERDPDLLAKLRAEWPGILAWAVRGCLAWQREGLKQPAPVLRGVEGWKRKADHVARFCNEELARDGGNLLPSAELQHHYRSWCERHGEQPLDPRKLKAALEGQDLTYKRTNTGSVWAGVKLRLDR